MYHLDASLALTCGTPHAQMVNCPKPRSNGCVQLVPTANLRPDVHDSGRPSPCSIPWVHWQQAQNANLAGNSVSLEDGHRPPPMLTFLTGIQLSTMPTSPKLLNNGPIYSDTVPPLLLPSQTRPCQAGHATPTAPTSRQSALPVSHITSQSRLMTSLRGSV